MERRDSIERREQYLKEKENSSLLSKNSLMYGAGTAAAAVGSAALFYRSGAALKLAGKIDTSYRALKSAASGASRELNKQHITFKDVKNAYDIAKKRFSEEKNRALDKPIRLRTEDTDNLFKTLISMNEKMRTAYNDGRKLYRNSNIVASAKEYYDTTKASRFDSRDINRDNRFKNFINDVSDFVDAKNEIRKEMVMAKAGITDNEEISFAEEIYQRMKANHDEEKEKDFAKKFSKKMKNEFYDKIINDLDTLEKKYGEKNNSFYEKLLNNVSGDKSATIKDVIENKKKIQASRGSIDNSDYDTKHKDVVEILGEIHQRLLREDKDKADRFLNLRPDAMGLRMHNGEMYSFNAPAELADDLAKLGARTLPGKILKLRSFEQMNKMPAISYIFEGTQDPILAAIVNPVKEDGTKSKAVVGNYVRIEDRLYSITEEGLKFKTDGLVAFSSRFGLEQRMVHQLAGDTAYKESDNILKRISDTGQDRTRGGETALSGFISRITKFLDEDYRGNLFGRLAGIDEQQLSRSIEAMALQGNDEAQTKVIAKGLNELLRVQNFMRKNIHSFSESEARELAEKTTGTASEIFQDLAEGNVDVLVDRMLKMGDNATTIKNPDLKAIYSRYINDPANAKKMLYLRTDRNQLSVSGGSLWNLVTPDYGTEGADFTEMLRTELSKEALFQHGMAQAEGEKDRAIIDLVSGLSSTTEDNKNAKRLTAFALFQNHTQINSSFHNKTLDEAIDILTNAEIVLGEHENDTSQFVHDEFVKLMNEDISILEKRDVEENVADAEYYNTVIHMKKSAGPISMIKSINESIKNGGNAFDAILGTAKEALTQLGAGRGDMENVTRLTMAPYFMLSRLSDDMNSMFGLGFSRETTRSTWAMMKGIATKRILPVAIGATYLEWGDDTVDAATGTSISGAFANGIANVDLASRRAFDAFGLTDWLDGLKSVNPIMQYWGDHTPFMSYDERKKYYESGYDPERAGAWWTFGGVQEARGSSIEYWTPSFDRRINSDYKDKSLYDGYFDKWSHSLLPTPSNPLSPIMAVLDPYWLEEKHADDRPYAISGPMFAENTPWGAVLNPTIGNIIKPQKNLHNFRLNHGVDIMANLHALNDRIRDKARDMASENIIQVSGRTMTPSIFTAYNAPEQDTNVYSVNIYGGQKTLVNKATGGGAGSSSRNISTSSMVYEDPSVTGIRSNMVTTDVQNAVYGVYNAPGQNLEDGFYEINDKHNAAVARALATDSSDISFMDRIRYKAKTGNGEMHASGDILINEKGEAGIYAGSINEEDRRVPGLTLEQKLKIDSLQRNGDTSIIEYGLGELVHKIRPENMLAIHNEKIKAKARANEYDDEQGILTPERLADFTPALGMQMLEDPEAVSDLLQSGKGYDMTKNVTTSARLIAGIYGYMAQQAFGFGQYNGKVLQNSAEMESFSRTFWDLNIGGMGGETADIIHRFIPEHKRNRQISPLMNEMPDWIPDTYKWGDPFVSIPKGEMRLPGKGYEALNELHPDQFGRYGAFDRFKILADIAPYSTEYKIWREIANKTVSNPALQEEMKEIRDRVSQQGKTHDFYEYNVIGKSLEHENIVIDEVMNYGRFRSGNKIYKLAGVSVKGDENGNMQQTLGQYLHPGMEVTIATDADDAYYTNKDSVNTINAAVYIDGMNLAQQMMENGDATKRKGDTSAPATLGNLSTFQRALGYASELVAHTDIPWLSDQWLRVRSPLESYQADYVYGTPSQSWDHPIDTMVKPALERAMNQPVYAKAVFREILDKAIETPGVSKTKKFFAFMGAAFSDRGAFVGGAIANIFAPGEAAIVSKSMRLFSHYATAGHFMTGGTSYMDEMSTGAYLGSEISRFFGHKRKLGGLLGAAAGALFRTAKGAPDAWIPKRVRDVWEMEDYFDRLTYIKYMGLYHKAAELALEEEDVDVERLADLKEENDSISKKMLTKLKHLKKALNLSHDMEDTEDKQEMKKILNDKINELANTKTTIEGGKWTHAALLYKQVAESTVYAMDDNSSMKEIITALPKSDREYYMEFVKERNEEKRQEILKYVSPFLKKALSLSWGTEAPKFVDNKEFFKHHELPDEDWAGWRADVDLDGVELKTIENEAMNMSDFGFYESQLRSPEVQAAPTVDYRDSTASLRSKLENVLKGKGLKKIDVDIQENLGVPTTDIVANIGMYTSGATVRDMIQTALG